MGAAEEWEYIEGNPVRKTKLPRRTGRKSKPVPTVEQIRLLTSSLREPTRSLVLLLVATGMRIGELLALRWKNVDLDTGLIRVSETVYDGHFDQPKTSRSIRVIPIGGNCIEVLQAIRPETISEDQLVFSNREGNPLDRRNLAARELRLVCKKMGLLGISWHSFRHCNATLLDSVGTPLGTVQALLGHTTSEITRTVYMHSIPEDQRRAVSNLEDVLFGPKWTQVAVSGNSPIPQLVGD